jgi:hypothetical protein
VYRVAMSLYDKDFRDLMRWKRGILCGSVNIGLIYGGLNL